MNTDSMWLELDNAQYELQKTMNQDHSSRITRHGVLTTPDTKVWKDGTPVEELDTILTFKWRELLPEPESNYTDAYTVVCILKDVVKKIATL